MKRTILFIAVIALVAVAVFGSQALADKPETLPTNPEMTNLLNSINQTVTDTQIKVSNIENEVDDIEAELANPAYGLVEIKAEVANIEDKVADIDDEVADIQASLDDPATGLAEIKAEVAAIEAKVNEMDAKWDGMVKMESYSGQAVLAAGNFTVPVEETYPEVRHVSLTLSVFPLLGWDADDFVWVLDEGVTSFIGGSVLQIGEDGPFYATVEFDTTKWSIWAGNGETDGGPWPVDYNYTVTYPE
jgi:septal ring factor EnvC (AmiA/AmiB activator)